MVSVPNGVETSPKISIAWVGHTNVTDRQTDRQTTDDRQTDGRWHIANVNVSSRSLKTTWQLRLCCTVAVKINSDYSRAGYCCSYVIQHDTVRRTLQMSIVWWCLVDVTPFFDETLVVPYVHWSMSRIRILLDRLVAPHFIVHWNGLSCSLINGSKKLVVLKDTIILSVSRLHSHSVSQSGYG